MSKHATAETASDALTLYRDAMEADALIQSGWHETGEDGRELACALGVLGPQVDDAEKCPAAIMPRWLAQMVPWFFDRQDFADAKAWGLKFYAELARIGGAVPFFVVHDWHANVVGPLAIEIAAERNGNIAAHTALADMHAKVLGGAKFSSDEWRPVLKDAYADAYADANVDASTNVDANAYAYTNAYANAYPYADADAEAYADADAYPYANAYPYADADARRSAMKRLATGMVECLSRVVALAAN
jgi:hypothetical protein